MQATSSANVSTVAPSFDDYCGCTSSASLLERLIDDAPDIFQHEVLPKLCSTSSNYYDSVMKNGNATALALLRRISRKCKAAVEAAGQPIAGFSEGVSLSSSYFYASVELFEWARANDMPLSSWHSPYYAATKGGGVEVLAKAREHGCKWDEWAFDSVASIGNLEALKYMHKEGCPWNKECSEIGKDNAMDHAARSGNVEMVRWLQSVGAEWGVFTLPNAAEEGGVPMLEFLWEQIQNGEYIPFDPEMVIDSACTGVDVESVKWCLAESRGDLRCELSAGCLAGAAEHSSLDMIKFLREDLVCPWDEHTCASAAYSDSLDILQWVRARGCPWDAWTMMHAAMMGHMEILSWAHANDAPWNKRVCEWAARGGNLEALVWLVEIGCPFDYRDTRRAAEQSRVSRPRPEEPFVRILSWLDENFAD